MTGNDCPPFPLLKAFHVGDLEDAEAEAVAGHLEGCAECEARLATLDDMPDTVGQFLRQSTPSTSSPDDPNAVPGYVGEYRILAEVGRGGMGVVYKALHPTLNRLAAVKMIVSGRYATAEDQMRFRIEAEALARLQHPAIVQVFEVGRHDGRPFLALEWVDGGTAERLVRGGGIPPREAAEMAEQIARAVHFAHTCGVLHRDLKPANVLLASGGREPPDSSGVSGGSHPPLARTAKVTDFGLAKLLDAGGQNQDAVTVSGSVIGTPSYMAPEQARSGAAVGHAADVYAIGAIFFALLTGRPPFEGSVHEVMRAVLEDPAPSVSRVRRGIPRDLATICAACLQKEPGKRYASAADLADDLRRWREGRPIVARPVPFWERAWLAARRRPAVAGLIAVAVFSLVAGAGVAGWKWWEAVEARHAAERREGEAIAARKLAELREARRAIEKGLLLCDRWDVALGLEWLDRGREGADRAGDADLAAAARANIAAWSARLPTPAATASRTDVSRLPGFTPAFESVAYTRSGNYLATAGSDLSLEVRRANDLGGEVRQNPTPITFGKSAITRSLRFSPVAEFTLAVGHANGYATVWDVTPGREPRRTHAFSHPNDEVWSVAFSPDGTSLATGCGDGFVRVWPLAGGPPVAFTGVRQPHKNADVQSVSFVPPRPTGENDRLVLAAGRNFGAKLWRADGTLHLSFGTEREFLFSAASCWVRDGLRVLVGGERHAQLWHVTGEVGKDGLWRPTAAQPHGRQVAHTHRVTAVTLAADGRTAITADHGGTVRIWDAESGRPRCQPLQNGDGLRDAAVRPDGGAVVAGGLDGVIRTWTVPPPPWAKPTIAHGPGVMQTYLDRTGRVVTATGESVIAWDADHKTARPLWQRTGSGRGKTAVQVEPGPGGDGFFVCTLGDDTHWIAPPGRGDAPPIPFPSAAATGAAFTPDGRELLTLYSGFTLGEPAFRWWALEGGTVHPRGVRGERAVRRPLAAAFRPPDGRQLLVGCASGEAVWLDVETGHPVRPLDVQSAPVTAVAFRADGSAAAVGCQDGAVRCWTADSFAALGPGFETGASVRALAFTADGGTLLTGLSDGTARLWDVLTGLPIGPPFTHLGPVNQVRFSADGKLLYTASADGMVHTWFVPNGVAATRP